MKFRHKNRFKILTLLSDNPAIVVVVDIECWNDLFISKCQILPRKISVPVCSKLSD